MLPVTAEPLVEIGREPIGTVERRDDLAHQPRGGGGAAAEPLAFLGAGRGRLREPLCRREGSSAIVRWLPAPPRARGIHPAHCLRSPPREVRPSALGTGDAGPAGRRSGVRG